MAGVQLAITLDSKTIELLDALVAHEQYPDRNSAIIAVLHERLDTTSENQFQRELAKLDAGEEVAFAELGMTSDMKEWPEY